MRYYTAVFFWLCMTLSGVSIAKTMDKKVKEKEKTMSIYDFEIAMIDGSKKKLSEYKNKVLLFVNVASKCGYTKQYTGLQALHEKFAKEGLVMIGFPCNQFGSQEPGTETEIQSFCSTTYKVTFPLAAKIDVNGPQSHPLWAYLKTEQKGLLSTEAIKWNFTKFLVDKKGVVVKRYAPADTPESFEKDIQGYLSAT